MHIHPSQIFTMTSARRLARPSDGEIIQETTTAGAGAEAIGGKDGPNLADNEDQQAAAHRSKEDEEDARKKKEEAEAALGVFLESWLRYRKEDAARKKEEEEDAARKKEDEEDDARKKKKEEEAEAAAASEKKNCFRRQYDKLIAIIEEDREMWEVKKEALDKMREWLMLLATLAVSIAYNAGLNPPGGLWQDTGNGHAVGTPVLQDTNRPRYLTFYYSNAMSFVTSLVIIVLLFNRKVSVQALVFTTMFDLMSLVVAYIAGTTSDLLSSIGLIVTAAAAAFIYFARGILILMCVFALVGVFAGVAAVFTAPAAVLMCLVRYLCCCPCIQVYIYTKTESKHQKEQAIKQLEKRRKQEETCRSKELFEKFQPPQLPGPPKDIQSGQPLHDFTILKHGRALV